MKERFEMLVDILTGKYGIQASIMMIVFLVFIVIFVIFFNKSGMVSHNYWKTGKEKEAKDDYLASIHPSEKIQEANEKLKKLDDKIN